MIDLYTGLPGHGKTLLAVTALAKLLKHWDTDKGSADRRQLWVWGIKDLDIPHNTIEVWPDTGKRGDPIPVDKRGRPLCALAFDWDDIPDGSLVIIDESQYIFPIRSPSAKVPAHVSFLNTQRHAGFDVWLITQHPKLIDNAIRRLVDKHTHIRKIFNWPRAVTYEWPYCEDGLQGLKKATMGQFNYPKSTYALYKSAEIHTKNTFKKPLWIWAPVIAIPVAAWAIPNAWDGMSKVMGGAALATAAPPPAKAASAPVAPPPKPVERPAVPSPAPALPIAPVAAASAPKWAGCIAVRNRCTCYASDGQKASAEPGMCEDHTGATLPAKAVDIPASLDRFASPAPVAADPYGAAVMAWADAENERRRTTRNYGR